MNIDAQAGQQVRLTELRTERQHGAFDVLHGWPMAKHWLTTLKASWEQHHGMVGGLWLQRLAEVLITRNCVNSSGKLHGRLLWSASRPSPMGRLSAWRITSPCWPSLVNWRPATV